MPHKTVHIKKAADNEAMASTLDLSVSSAPNWAIIMIFYAAVHYVEAYLFTQGIDSPLHGARDTAIQRDAKIKTIWRPYERLKSASEFARYEATFFTPTQINYLKPNLEQIKTVINPLL